MAWLSKQPTVRIISCAWGEAHVADFLNYCLPALLASGNLPEMGKDFEIRLVFLTEESRFGAISNHQAWRAANKVCDCQLVSLDDLLIGSHSYGMTLTQSLYRGFSDQGPHMTGNWQVFFNSDFIAADGSLGNLAKRMKLGPGFILSPSYCVNAEVVKPIFDNMRDPITGSLALRPRVMADIILRHRHATIRAKTVNQAHISFLYNDQFYWLVDNRTLIGHQIPIAMVAMMPLQYLSEPTTYWDYGITADFMPGLKPIILGDSDEFLMCELRPRATAQHALRLGRRTNAELAASLHNFATMETIKVALEPLTLHSDDLPPNIDTPRKQLADHVATIINMAGPLPTGRQHFQWQSHAEKLTEFQRKFWSERAAEIEQSGNAIEPTRDLVPRVEFFPINSMSDVELQTPAQQDKDDCHWSVCDHALDRYNFPQLTNAIADASESLLDRGIMDSAVAEIEAPEVIRRFARLIEAMLAYRGARDLSLFRSVCYEILNETSPNCDQDRIEFLRLSTSRLSIFSDGYSDAFLGQLVAPLHAFSGAILATGEFLEKLAALIEAEEGALGSIVTKYHSSLSKHANVDFDVLARRSPMAAHPNLDYVKYAIDEMISKLSRSDWDRPEGEFPTADDINTACLNALEQEKLDFTYLGWIFVQLLPRLYDVSILHELRRALEEKVLLGRADFAFLHSLIVDVNRDLNRFFDLFRPILDAHLRWLFSTTCDTAHDIARVASVTFWFVERVRDLRKSGTLPRGVLALPFAVMERSNTRSVAGNLSPTEDTQWSALKKSLRCGNLSWRGAARIPFYRILHDLGELSALKVLHVDDGSSFAHEATSAVKDRLWMPLELISSQVLAKPLNNPAPLFDLCIIDLPVGKLETFVEFYSAISPMMKFGARIIVFSMNSEARRLPQDDPTFITGVFPPTGLSRVIYTSSKFASMSRKLSAIGWAIRQKREIAKPLGQLAWVLAMSVAAHLALVAAAYERWRDISRPDGQAPLQPDSITLEVSVI